MRNIFPSILTAVLLFGCSTSPYRYFSHNGHSIRISSDDMDYIENNGYSQQERNDFLKFATSDNAITRRYCSDGTATSPYTCETGTVIAYENFLRHQQEITQRNQTYMANKQQEITKKLQQSGCKNWFKLNFPYKVLQQISEGTLVTVKGDFAYYAHQTDTPDVFLITKNNVDKNNVDNETIQDGFFEQIGTFQYMNSFGATRTVKKLKRCSTETF